MRNKDQFSKVQHMWVFAMFDLPTETKEQRKEYTHFRKALLADGFCMLQFSVYARFCESRAHGETFQRHIENILPPDGQVRVLMVTDKQFGMMANFIGHHSKLSEEPPNQLLLF